MTGGGESGDTPDRVSALVAELTRAEKLSLVRGTYPGRGERDVSVAGYLPPVERVGVEPLRLADGPLGVRSGESTAFPATLALGAAFDPELAAAFGRAVGAEARATGIDVLLAPGCNLLRVPQCGRAFEYYGEDPHHTGKLAAAAVRGIQSRGVVATPKHYVANTQEHNRVRASAEVSERALRELYLRAFETVITEGDAGAVMAAYNRVNGSHMTRHERLLSLLREEFGFEGPVLSDWWAVRDGLAAARAGLDLEMPGVGLAHVAGMGGGPAAVHALRERWPDPLFPDGPLAWLFASAAAPGGVPTPHASRFARALPAALDAGTLDPAQLDEMVTRVLRLHERVGALGDGRRQRAEPDGAVHRDLAERIAVRGAVLLQNDRGTLPLDQTASIAVVGPNVETAKSGGGGSSAVTPVRSVSPALGIRERAVGPVTVAPGHPPLGDGSVLGAAVEFPTPSFGDTGAQFGDALAAAGSADVAVVVLQDDAGEFRDRETLALPGRQDRLVEAVAGVAERTVVVLQTAGPVELPWLDAVDTVLELWYPGQEAGRALAAVLYGDADPGGRLPVTFAAAADYPATDPASYPGVEGSDGYPEVTHAEGVFVGYRFLDDRGLDPVFPFGHGLGYTTFAYDDAEPTLDGDEQSVQVRIENTGERRGREVLQVYARPPESEVPRPPRELAGFASVALAPGERRTVAVPLDDRAFARYDEATGEWVVDPGTYTLAVGRSAREPCLELSVEPTS
jgi:beta-glucosidase